MDETPQVYTASNVEATGYAKTITGDTVTATATASWTSTNSEAEALAIATAIALQTATIEAKNSANIIDQTLDIVETEDLARGPQGAIGEQGEQGEQGDTGPQGETGADGTNTVVVTDRLYELSTPGPTDPINKQIVYNNADAAFASVGDANLRGVIGQIYILTNPLNPSIYAMVYSPTLNVLFIGGNFAYVNNILCNGLACYNFYTSSWFAFGAGLNVSNSSAVYALALNVTNPSGIILYVGGNFTSLATITAASLAQINISTNTVTPLSLSTNPVVYSLLYNNSTLFIGGTFTVTASGTQNNIVSYDGTAFQSVGLSTNAGVNGGVYALATDGIKVYIGGAFTGSNTATSGIPNVIMAGVGVFDPRFSSLIGLSGNGINGRCNALLYANNNLYAGGNFNWIGYLSTDATLGLSSANMAVYNTFTNKWSSIGINPAGSQINSLAFDSVGRLYIFGSSTVINVYGTNTREIIPTTNIIPATIYASVIANNTLYIGGNFDSLGNTPRLSIGSLNTTENLTIKYNGANVAIAFEDGTSVNLTYYNDKWIVSKSLQL